jgi:hypothetical protein
MRPIPEPFDALEALGLIAGNQAYSVWHDTPTFSATCEIDNPSLITANTAGYLCSTTLNSLIQGVSRINRNQCHASAETLTPISRRRTVTHQPRSYSETSGAGGARTRDQRIMSPRL